MTKHKKGFRPGVSKPIPPPKDFDDFLARLSPEARKAILALIADDLMANGYLNKPEEKEGNETK